MSASVRTPGAYRERLHVPLRWWVQGSMFVASLWLAMVVALPGLVAWPATALAVAALSALLLGYGAPLVVVEAGHLQVGRARIEGGHLGRAEPLDAEQTKRAAGVEADARAFLVIRPYLKRAVRVRITDPADPAPYWLVSTRHPEALAGAIAVLTSEGSSPVE